MSTAEKLAQGDAETWARFLDHLEPSVRRTISRLTDDPEKQEEAFQDVCSALISAFGKTIGHIAASVEPGK